MPEEEDSQSELLIAEDKMSPEQEGQLMPRYEPASHVIRGLVTHQLARGDLSHFWSLTATNTEFSRGAADT